MKSESIVPPSLNQTSTNFQLNESREFVMEF